MKTCSRTMLWGLLALAARVAAADPTDARLSAALDALVRPYLETGNFSGEVLVARGDRVLVDRGYGRASVELNVPVRTGDRFPIASISKSFTAAAILLLQEQGKLRLDDPVARFVPDFPNAARITLDQLLTHRSGVPNIVQRSDFRERAMRSYSTAQAVAQFQELPLEFEPGSASRYSNSNYVLLALVIERASGRAYGSFLRESLLERLGLGDTDDRGPASRVVPRLVSGYSPVGVDALERSRHFDTTLETGAASLYSTPADLLRWVRGLATGKALSASSWHALSGAGDGVTRGFTRKRLFGRDAITASGWDGAGFAAELVYIPTEELSVVVASNLNISSVAGELANAAVALALAEPHAARILGRAPVPPARAVGLAGRYRLGSDFYVPGTVLDLDLVDGRLLERQHDPERLMGLIPTADDRFIHRSSWGEVRFHRDPEGRVTGLRFYDRFEATKLAPGEP